MRSNSFFRFLDGLNQSCMENIVVISGWMMGCASISRIAACVNFFTHIHTLRTAQVYGYIHLWPLDMRVGVHVYSSPLEYHATTCTGTGTFDSGSRYHDAMYPCVPVRTCVLVLEYSSRYVPGTSPSTRRRCCTWLTCCASIRKKALPTSIDL